MGLHLRKIQHVIILLYQQAVSFAKSYEVYTRERQGIWQTIVLAGIIVQMLCMSGCSFGKNIGASGSVDFRQKETKAVGIEDGAAAADAEDGGAEDLAGNPVDFSKLKTVKKIEENGISYYRIQTSRDFPLPLNEWAKLDLATENGTAAPAYIRFTDYTKDIKKIEKYMEQYAGGNNLPAMYPHSQLSDEVYVLMDYEVFIGKDAHAKSGKLSYACVQFPIQLFSTMRNGNFGNYTEQDRECLVADVSMVNSTNADTDKLLAAGSTVEKTILCSVPKDYTAYGVRVPFVGADGKTNMIYFKLEY